MTHRSRGCRPQFVETRDKTADDLLSWNTFDTFNDKDQVTSPTTHSKWMTTLHQLKKTTISFPGLAFCSLQTIHVTHRPRMPTSTSTSNQNGKPFVTQTCWVSGFRFSSLGSLRAKLAFLFARVLRLRPVSGSTTADPRRAA